MSLELHSGRKESLLLVSPPLAALQNMMETQGGPSGVSASLSSSLSSVAAVAAAAAAAGALPYSLHHQPNDSSSVCRTFQLQQPSLITPLSSSATDHSITDILFNSSRSQLLASDGMQAHYHHRGAVPHLPRVPFTSDGDDSVGLLHRTSPSTTSGPHPQHLHFHHHHQQQRRLMLEQGFGVAVFHHGLQPPSPPSLSSCCPPLRSDVSCRDGGGSVGEGEGSPRGGLYWPQQQPTLLGSSDGLSRQLKEGGGADQQPWTNATTGTYDL